MKPIKDLNKKEIRKRVKKGQYTDWEWNQFSLCRFVDYSAKPLNSKFKINYNK